MYSYFTSKPLKLNIYYDLLDEPVMNYLNLETNIVSNLFM